MELFTENLERNRRLPLFMEENTLNSYDCSMLKLILLEQGTVILNINNASVLASAPMVICLNEKEHVQLEKGEGFVSKIIYFSPSIINSHFDMQNIYESLKELPETARLDHFYLSPFLNRSKSKFGKISIGVTTAKKLAAIYDALKNQLGNLKDSYWPCRSRSFFMELLMLVQFCWSKEEELQLELPEVETDFNDILLHIHLNYGRKITIDELTAEFHTNRNTLNRRFRLETGMPVMEYIIRLRLKIACMLLSDTRLPVSDIMERTGFTDVGYWGRTFKKIIGMTPSGYRKLHSGSE